MKIILFNQNPMITKLFESVSKKLELSMEDFNRYQELSTRLKEEPEWILIADDECLEKLDQVDWLELKEIISQNKNSVCVYKKGNEAQPFLEGFEMKIKKPFLPTEVLKVLQKKLGSNASELESNQNLDPTQEVLETNWDELENLGDLEALVQEEPNNEEQLLPTLNNQKEKEEVKEEVKETPQEEEKPKDDEIQEGETLKDEEVSKELETQEEIKEETQEQAKEQEPIKEETQEIKEEKQEKTQDSPSTQELEAMQELVKEIQENSNGQENKKETQENAETPQESAETPQDVETPQEKETQELETQESTEIPQEKTQEKETQELETQESTEIPQEKTQEKETQETPQEISQESTEKTQKLETQEDHYESIEDIPEPVMAQAMGEELPFLNESVAKIPNNENDTETPKESVIKTPQEKEESDKTSSPLELRLNLQDLLKSLNQESLKSLLENKTLSIKITLEDKKPDA
ncbi:chemotaxis regulatory protein ChePep [Helicobacter pylori]